MTSRASTAATNAPAAFQPSPFAPQVVNDVLRSTGRPLDGATRGFMEPLFGRDFSDVRIHTGSLASRSARAVNADAYTVGRDVVFAEGKYAPGSRAGRHLLAHELTHTLQQSAAAAAGPLSIGHPHDPSERDADRVADAVASGAVASPEMSAAPGLQRQEADSPAPDSGTAADTGPAPYDGCGEYRQAVVNARTEATRLAGRARTLLDEQHVAQAAPLLERHFHLDPASPGAASALQLVRDQFARMQQALSSGSRIFCRSPDVHIRRSGPSMPVSGDCGPRTRAHSNSCAAASPDALVNICEQALVEGDQDALVKTMLHEFAHVACNGNPPVSPAGSEVYYPGDRLPGTTINDLVQADSYAWFAIQAGGILGPEASAPAQAASGEDHTGFGVLTAVGGALTIAGAIGLGYGINEGSDAGIGLGIAGLALGGLGLGFGIAGLAGAFDRRRPQQQQQQQGAARSGQGGGAPRTLSELATLSAWQLAQLPESAFAAIPAAPEGSGPRLEDYARAWRMVRCVRDLHRLTVDPLTPGQRGRNPTEAEWPVLRGILSQILSHENVGEIVSGPGGRGDLGSPPIANNVRVLNRLDWGIKRYQLERLVSSIGAGADEAVRQLWGVAECGIRADASARIVDQERQMAAFNGNLVSASAGIGGFYFPPDDTVYVNEGLMGTLMGTEGDADAQADAPVIVGHEMGHLVGGRERTREAFVRHFGGETWICYWSAFEEGMAEITARDALTSGRPPSDRNYGQYVQLMRQIMTTLGADRVRRAYFTGAPDREIFEALRRGLPQHMDAGLPPVCRQPGALQP